MVNKIVYKFSCRIEKCCNTIRHYSTKTDYSINYEIIYDRTKFFPNIPPNRFHKCRLYHYVAVKSVETNRELRKFHQKDIIYVK